jgi:hypothetical protein
MRFPFRNQVVPDFSRHRGLLNLSVCASAVIAVVGCGGAAALVEDLARSGIARWTVVDFDIVSATNLATQGVYTTRDIGRPKVKALAARIRAINPAARVTTIVKKYQQLSKSELAEFWKADLVLAMTDNHDTQSRINQDAVAARVDTIFSCVYRDCEAVDITATFADAIAAGKGCHHCNAKARYDAHAAGFQDAGGISSYSLAATYVNALIGLIAIARLHQRAGVRLPVTDMAEQFAQKPCLISRLVPSFGSDGPADAFADIPPEPFTTRLFPLDSPADWQCPDCGTRGVLPVRTVQPAPVAAD